MLTQAGYDMIGVDQSEEMVKNLYRCGACYQNQWKILKEKYGDHFKK